MIDRFPNLGITSGLSGFKSRMLGRKENPATTTNKITLELEIDLNNPFDVKTKVIDAVNNTVNKTQPTTGSSSDGGSGPNFMIGSGKKKAKINTQKNKKRKYLKKTLPRKKTKRTYSRKKI